MNKVNIIITHKCNLMCKHCYMNAGNKDFEDEKEIFKRFKEVINKLNVKQIMLTGGECTISPIFYKILDYCKDNNIEVTLFTNGLIFNRKILEYVDNYSLSIDGLKTYHNNLRGSDKAYDNTINTIKLLKENNKNITVQITVMKDNIEEILSIIKLLYSYGVKNINLCSLLDEGRSIENKLDSNIDIDYLEEIIEKAYRETGYNIKIHTNIFNEFSTKVFLKTKSIIFPLWIDLVDNNFYLVKDKFSKDLNALSVEEIEELNKAINNYISKNISSWENNKYLILENVLGGEENE